MTAPRAPLPTSPIDALLSAADDALRAVSGSSRPLRPTPTRGGGTDAEAPRLSESERRLSGALMRVNHVGEVCAQALYLSLIHI